MTKAARISYIFILITLVSVGWLNLTTALLTVLFSYFALDKLKFGKGNFLPLVLFLLLVSAIFYAFMFFLRQAWHALPDIITTAIPLVIQYADKYGVDLPFSDLQTLKAVSLETMKDQLETIKTMALETVKDQLRYLGNFAKIATKEFVSVAIGMVVAMSMFVDAKLDLDRGKHKLKNNLYALSCEQIAMRFETFYQSFATVMGAQLLISAINTGLTSIFILWSGLPYAALVIVLTFLCGLLPIIGNLISNSIIIGIAITISPKLALASLIFLVLLHKLEYFLNSKIIGERIKNPMWLTLLGLIIGERLMGIPGMILAPVILNYVKVEASRIEIFENKKGSLFDRPDEQPEFAPADRRIVTTATPAAPAEER